MSTAEAPANDVIPNGNPGSADGSPSGGTAGTNETSEHAGTDEGAEPESAGGDEQLSAPANQRQAAQSDERDRIIAEYEALRDQITTHPNRDKILSMLYGTGEQGGGDEDPVAHLIDENWPKTIQNEDGTPVRNRSNEVMHNLVQAIRQSVRAEIQAEYEPKLRGVAQTLNGSKFERALASEGIEADDPQFVAFQRQFEKANPSFKKLREAGRAEEAAGWVAAKFAMRGKARNDNVAARRRIDEAKGARTNTSSPRGGPSAKTPFGKLDDYIKARNSGYDGLGR